MEDLGYPKYQYSVFLKNGRDQQIVIRTETFEELVEAKKNVDKILEKAEPTRDLASEFVGTPTPTVNGQPVQTRESYPTKPECVVHHTEMVFKEGISKKTNKAYAFWGCTQKDNGNYCDFTVNSK